MPLSRSSRTGNLPVDVTTFVGRGQEIAQVRSLLPGCRLVTLTGVGGVGKTRLGLRVASELTRAFKDGVWLVEFAGLHDPELVASTIAAVLGIESGGHRTAVNRLAEYLGDREILLILDNCEHLLDACALVASELLRACPGLRILATSREPLGISGEHLYAVPPLAVPAADASPTIAELTEFPAVRLFVERAAAVKPDFSLTPENKAAVIAICRRLDGIPLAIELAAGRLRALSPRQLQERLQDRYELLTGGSRTALPRQQTLRALMDWSYDLCTPMEQLLWARLAVFEDSFDLAAAERVCSGGDLPEDKMLYVLAGLVDKSVLATAEYDGVVRYHLLGTLREYVVDRLDDGERAALRRRHRDWYAEVVDRAEAEWFSASQLVRCTELRRDHPNLRAALTYSLQTPGENRAGLRLAACLRFHWLMSGHITEGVAWLERMLAAYPTPDLVRLKGLRVQGHLTALVRDRAAATRVLDEARDLASKLGDPHELAHVYQARGLSAVFGGASVEAGELLAEALRRHAELGDKPNAVYDQIHVGLVAGQLGHTRAAAAMIDAAVAACRASGDNWTTSFALFAAGIHAIRQGEYRRAAALHQESLRLRLPLGDKRNIGLNVEALAWCAIRTGDAERAARLFGASLAVQEASGTRLRSFHPLQRLHAEHEPLTRSALGSAAFEREREQGRRLPFPDAVAYALGEVRTPVRTAEPEAPAFGPLTKRERQIAELVADGLTNKEIAARLVISTRTAEGHVEKVLIKLNFNSRAQVAAWVATQRAREGGDADF